mmetsp:Transcript_35284/g.70578  ORF Transcript_35284/g.70578 Transcript_35284/m.70578 type:complete len:145 (-) Transcript_35284:122-556(-)
MHSQQLQRELDDVDCQLAALKHAHADLDQRAAALTHRAADAEARCTDLTRDHEQLKARLAAAQNDVEDLRRLVASLQDQLAEAAGRGRAEARAREAVEKDCAVEGKRRGEMEEARAKAEREAESWPSLVGAVRFGLAQTGVMDK